jgi:hypothetical protein
VSSALIEESADAVDYLPRFKFEAASGHAGQLDSSQLQVLVTAAVLLERLMPAVGRVDVRFDRKAQLGPVDVELVAGDDESGAGSRKSSRLDESQEFTLQARAGEARWFIEGDATRKRKGRLGVLDCERGRSESRRDRRSPTPPSGG